MAVNEAFLAAHRVDTSSLEAGPLIGMGHVEGEIASLAARLSDPERAARLGAEVPRSVLLLGPAGIGKTHSARALAVRLGGLPVYEVGADELTGPVVRALFAGLDARHPRSMLVIDEIDLVGGERSESDAASRRVLAALLTALDGLRPASGVLLVAATSQTTWDLDPALLRAGRLGFSVELRHPDQAARAEMMAFFLSGRPLAPDVDVAPLAEATGGCTPADLRAACADAAGIALSSGREWIAQEDLLAALERRGRVVPEEPEPEPVDPSLLRRVSVHESGHLVAGSLLGVGRLVSVEIGAYGGSVVFGDPTGEAPLDERAERDSIATSLAGIASERILLGSAAISQGHDVRAALASARRIVEIGSAGGLPPMDMDASWLDGTAPRDRMADAVAALMSEGRERAAALLAGHRAALAQVADRVQAEAARRLSENARRRSVVLDCDTLRADLERILAEAAGSRP